MGIPGQQTQQTPPTNPNPAAVVEPPKPGAATPPVEPGIEDPGFEGNPPDDPAFRRMKEDMLRYKREAAELREQSEKRKLDELKASQRWQEVAEVKEREATEAKEETARLKKALVVDRKNQAIREAALKAGIRREALEDLDLIDLEDVTIETTSTGRVNVIGVPQAVQRLKTLRPHWFGNPAPGVNPETPGVSSAGGPVTVKDLMEAERKAKQSGDWSDYRGKLLQFQQAKRARG